eukprot:2091180-Heterocapsa_arctica.AAC.2
MYDEQGGQDEQEEHDEPHRIVRAVRDPGQIRRYCGKHKANQRSKTSTGKQNDSRKQERDTQSTILRATGQRLQI